MLISIAGRVAKAYIAETPGVYRPSWTIDQIGEHIGTIRNMEASVVFPVVPNGFPEHIRYSFEMAAKGTSNTTRQR
jgi:hypothetical protein